METLRDKVVLITGASAGIGAALATAFAGHGARVVVTGRRLSRLERLAAELVREGHQALAAPCDVTRDGDCEAAVAKAVSAFGRLDVLVANAGYGVVGRVDTLSLEDYRRQFETNVFGVIRTIQAGLDELKRTQGRLVIMSSVSGYIASPGVSPYAMSKFALQALAGSLYQELAPLGVSVTCVCPGFVESEIRRVDNSGRLQDDVPDPVPSWLVMPARRAARQIVTAVMRRKPEVVITAHGKVIVWIQRHLPGLLRAVMSLSRGRGYRDLRKRGQS